MHTHVFTKLYPILFFKKELQEKDDALCEKISRLQRHVDTAKFSISDKIDIDLISSAGKQCTASYVLSVQKENCII